MSSEVRSPVNSSSRTVWHSLCISTHPSTRFMAIMNFASTFNYLTSWIITAKTLINMLLRPVLYTDTYSFFFFIFWDRVVLCSPHHFKCVEAEASRSLGIWGQLGLNSETLSPKEKQNKTKLKNEELNKYQIILGPRVYNLCFCFYVEYFSQISQYFCAVILKDHIVFYDVDKGIFNQPLIGFTRLTSASSEPTQGLAIGLLCLHWLLQHPRWS